MLTSKDLYNQYSLNPCSYYSATQKDNGRGSVYDLKRIIAFLKHLDKPCYKNLDTSTIDGTGRKKLALTFKFLGSLDKEAFAEMQPRIDSGTAYSVRNAADISRACYFIANNRTSEWKARMATEYLEHFCGNSLPDCLMMLGPDMIEEETAYNDTAPSTLGCFYFGASSKFFCYTPPESEISVCVCGIKPTDCPEDDPNPDPCCFEGADFENQCCSVGRTSRIDFSYAVPFNDNMSSIITKNVYFSKITSLDNLDKLELPIAREIKINDVLVISDTDKTKYILTTPYYNSAKSYQKTKFLLKHLGILERKDYGGYANFISPGGKNFNAVVDDIFLEYFLDTDLKPALEKCKTISAILDVTGPTEANAGSNPSVTTNTQYIVDSIKDLVYNGYGVVLFSNVGFPNIRDALGMCYPDRIWYQTYTIIGYDDRKLEYPECVYVLSCPFGDWIQGGHPSWGPLPPGCFLVTESHLKCMVNFNPGLDFYDCRVQYCNPVLRDCETTGGTNEWYFGDPIPQEKFEGCGAPEEGKCFPYYCTKQQSAFGIAFAISLSSDGFPEQTLEHEDFYPVTVIRDAFKEQNIYFDIS